MSLLDDLKNLLTRHHLHISTQVNQGTARLVEDHLSQLEATAEADIATVETKVHSVLGELYTALNAFVAPTETAPPAESAPAIAPGPDAAAPAEPETAPEPVAEPVAAADAPTGMH